jgi:hypothetical protein
VYRSFRVSFVSCNVRFVNRSFRVSFVSCIVRFVCQFMYTFQLRTIHANETNEKRQRYEISVSLNDPNSVNTLKSGNSFGSDRGKYTA